MCIKKRKRNSLYSQRDKQLDEQKATRARARTRSSVIDRDISRRNCESVKSDFPVPTSQFPWSLSRERAPGRRTPGSLPGWQVAIYSWSGSFHASELQITRKSCTMAAQPPPHISRRRSSSHIPPLALTGAPSPSSVAQLHLPWPRLFFLVFRCSASPLLWSCSHMSSTPVSIYFPVLFCLFCLLSFFFPVMVRVDMDSWEKRRNKHVKG